MNSKLLADHREIAFFSFLGLCLGFLLILSFIAEQQVEREQLSVPAHVVTDSPFDKVALSAKAAFVFDARTGDVLFAKNENERLPLASLTKVMAALVALDIAEPESVVVITPSALLEHGDSGLYPGERWSLKELLDFSLTSSSNDGMAAVALALGALDRTTTDETVIREDFVQKMNEKASTLGMLNTYYFNETGLDESNRKGGAYGTAKDMAILFNHALNAHPELFEATRYESVTVSSDTMTHVAQNTDSIVSDIPGIKASKTGYTDIAGGNLVVAFDPELGHPIIISVLGSTQQGRFQDVQKLVDASLQWLQAARVERAE